MPGYVYAEINSPALDTLRRNIPQRAIADTLPDWCKTGIEDHSHCTLYFGINPEVTFENMYDRFWQFFGRHLPMVFHPEGLSMFEAPDWDCLIVAASKAYSKPLHILNASFQRTFAYKGSEYDFTPHVTIAYLKKGLGKEYIKMFKTDLIRLRPLPFDQVFVSLDSDPKPRIFPLGL